MEDLLFQKNGSTKTSRVKIGLEYSKYFYKLIKLRAYGGGVMYTHIFSFKTNFELYYNLFNNFWERANSLKVLRN